MKSILCFLLVISAYIANAEQREARQLSIGNDVIQTLMKNFAILTDYMASIQKVFMEVNSQVSRLVSSSTRLMIGVGNNSRQVRQVPDASGFLSQVIDTLTRSLAAITEQVSGIQRIFTDLNQQVAKLVSTSTRIVSGRSVADGNEIQAIPGTPVDILGTIMKRVEDFSNLIPSFTKILTDMSRQINQLIATGTRIVGVESVMPSVAGGNPEQRPKRQLDIVGIATSPLQILQQIQKLIGQMIVQITEFGAQITRTVSSLGSRIVPPVNIN